MAGAWIQWALEEAPNAETASNDVSSNVFYVRADSIKVDRGQKNLEESGKTIGVMGKGPHLGIGSYTPKVSVKGLSIRPSDIVLVFGQFGGVITTTPGGSGVTDPEAAAVPAGATKHVVGFAEDAPKTGQFIVKDAGGKYWKVRGAALSSATLVEAGDAFSFDLEFEALYAAEIPNPSLTPSFDAATPFRRGDQTVTWLTGSADTKDFTLKLENGLEVSRRRDTVSDYPDLMMFKNDESGDPALSGTITKRTMVDADWEALEGGTQFESVIKMTHRENIGATGRTSAVWIEMPGVQHIQENPDDIANVRRRETKFDWEARVDLATATLATITVVNGTAAYETYA